MVNPKEKGDIRQQLFNLGFRESPLAMVERLYDNYQDLLNQALNDPRKRQRLEGRLLSLRQRIQTICETRSVGNPFKGERIEWKNGRKPKAA
jgi:hypothetical protein